MGPRLHCRFVHAPIETSDSDVNHVVLHASKKGNTRKESMSEAVGLSSLNLDGEK